MLWGNFLLFQLLYERSWAFDGSEMLGYLKKPHTIRDGDAALRDVSLIEDSSTTSLNHFVFLYSLGGLVTTCVFLAAFQIVAMVRNRAAGKIGSLQGKGHGESSSEKLEDYVTYEDLQRWSQCRL
mmetsp:Transcript_6335/g.15691  ORF Transcript_6335/g.15691 Transcript_6335/m.15691 type:complete len:125 (-) Transcript_6335:110-484(-)